jgi:hypothetical protein
MQAAEQTGGNAFSPVSDTKFGLIVRSPDPHFHLISFATLIQSLFINSFPLDFLLVVA